MRVRNKLLLAISVPVGLLLLQIALVNVFIRELQTAVTFISDAHQTIEDDFAAVDLVAKLRIEVKKLPSLYVSANTADGEGMGAILTLLEQLSVHIGAIRQTENAKIGASDSLLAVDTAFGDLYRELDLTKAALASGQVDMDTMLERAIFADTALVDLSKALNFLALDLRKQLQSAVDREREIHNRPVIVSIVIGGLTVVMLLVFTWLVVDRYFVTRLTALSESMLAIAGGELRTELPKPIGDDEVAEMARALGVFRDTAVEVEEHNLREVAEARQRLIDAIESISEGFSLYDQDDRFVLSNRRYLELMYPGENEVIKPGTPFINVVRAAAYSGNIHEAKGREDDWIAERMARHIDPKGAFLQHNGDDFWIEVTEYKTAEGGTVATYNDITDQKQSEQALLEEKRRTEEANKAVTQKNSMLEGLSVKLAKYLSPQVYSSIFRGEQSVEIASKRKKLTVAFSDIAGFTETTDKLESEELTGLLNNYLTEMSNIALEHGATIDKYIGDAIMIFFGDPESRGPQEDAIACVNMSIAMQRRIGELQKDWRSRGIEKPFQIRIGINTGYCTVGNFGSEDRMDYTIIGNEVNLAARLQTVANPGEIVIAHETFSLVQDEITAVEGQPRIVKGFENPIRNYIVNHFQQNVEGSTPEVTVNKNGVRISINLNNISPADRTETTEIIRDVLKLLRET